MSLSSWSRMWQCHTYPGPAAESEGNGLTPSAGGGVTGVYCGAKRINTRVTLPGGATKVSFQPLSCGEGGSEGPVRKSWVVLVAGSNTSVSTLARTVGWSRGSVVPFRLSQYALKRST